MSPEDRGNWTGGEIGVGILKGTNFGLSAASYPHLNLRDLTSEAADAIYRRDYWQPVRGDELPAGLDLMVFDHAVNAGVGVSVRLLQAALEVAVDGQMGTHTLLAARHADARGVILWLSQAQRAFYEAGAGTVFRHGLIRRVALRTDAALAMRGDGRANPEAVEPDVGQKAVICEMCMNRLPQTRKWKFCSSDRGAARDFPVKRSFSIKTHFVSCKKLVLQFWHNLLFYKTLPRIGPCIILHRL